jgi:hypothetical protein
MKLRPALATGLAACLLAAAAPAQTTPPPPDPRAPFGAGVPVQVTASGKPVTVFVAPLGGTDPSRLADYDFVRVGKTPSSFVLPPGRYALEVESPSVTHASRVVEIGKTPKRLLVESGSQGTRDAGTLLLGFGIAGLLGGAAVLVAGSKSTELDEVAIGVPLLAAGGALTAVGIGLFVAGRTDIEDPDEERKAHAVPPGPRSLSLRLGARF